MFFWQYFFSASNLTDSLLSGIIFILVAGEKRRIGTTACYECRVMNATSDCVIMYIRERIKLLSYINCGSKILGFY